MNSVTPSRIGTCSRPRGLAARKAFELRQPRLRKERERGLAEARAGASHERHGLNSTTLSTSLAAGARLGGSSRSAACVALCTSRLVGVWVWVRVRLRLRVRFRVGFRVGFGLGMGLGLGLGLGFGFGMGMGTGLGSGSGLGLGLGIGLGFGFGLGLGLGLAFGLGLGLGFGRAGAARTRPCTCSRTARGTRAHPSRKPRGRRSPPRARRARGRAG